MNDVIDVQMDQRRGTVVVPPSKMLSAEMYGVQPEVAWGTGYSIFQAEVDTDVYILDERVNG